MVVAQAPSLPQQSHGRLNSVRSVLSEWKQLFDGCNFIKRKDSTSRSRRTKDEKVQQAGGKRGASVSNIGAKHAVINTEPSNVCVCDSINDQMIECFTKVPDGIDSNEWLATHTLALFDHVNALCGSVSELCTHTSCPFMSYPGTSKALYVDERGKRHASYSAPMYMDCVMSYCEKMSKSEDLFPTRYGSTFSTEFLNHCRRVMRLLWHCCGHLYTNHWDQLDHSVQWFSLIYPPFVLLACQLLHNLVVLQRFRPAQNRQKTQESLQANLDLGVAIQLPKSFPPNHMLKHVNPTTVYLCWGVKNAKAIGSSLVLPRTQMLTEKLISYANRANETVFLQYNAIK